SVSILVLMLVPELFVRFSNVVSLSQARRAAGFIPFAFVLVGVFALLARSVLVPLALAAGIVLQLQWPGNFAYGGAGGPGSVTWIALVGGAAALAAGLALRREPVRERWGPAGVGVVLFCAPVAVHALRPFHPRRPAAP